MRNKIEEMQSVIDSWLSNKGPIKVLEAGCGSMSNIKLGSEKYIVGIDISERQLNNNDVVQEKIIADIQTYELPQSEYDMIICWDVLEHLSTPESALTNFAKTIKKNGLIVLALPNLFSPKSIIAKLTPYKLHRWIYNLIYGTQRFGTPGYEPFPTYLRYAIAPRRIKQFALNNGLSLEYFATHESGLQRKIRERCGLVNKRWRLFVILTKLLSLSFINAEASDCLFVLRKQ